MQSKSMQDQLTVRLPRDLTVALKQAAERMQVPLIIHPLNPMGIERLGKYFLTHIVGLLADTTVGVASMYFSGVLDRFPDLKIILCHGGGFLPYQFGRMTRGREIQPDIQ